MTNGWQWKAEVLSEGFSTSTSGCPGAIFLAKQETWDSLPQHFFHSHPPSQSPDKVWLWSLKCQMWNFFDKLLLHRKITEARVLLDFEFKAFAIAPLAWFVGGETKSTKFCQKRQEGVRLKEIKNLSPLRNFKLVFRYLRLQSILLSLLQFVVLSL